MKVSPYGDEDVQGLVRSARAAGHGTNASERLRDACEQFEAVFVQLLLKEMRRGVSGSLFGGGAAGEFYAGLFDWEIARSVSENARLGIGESLFRQLTEFARGREVREEAATKTNNETAKVAILSEG